MIEKPKKKSKTAYSYKWKTFRDKFLKGKANHAGYYTCNACGQPTLYPEVDHIIKRSVAPHLIFDEANLQILDHDCHLRKDSGFTYR